MKAVVASRPDRQITETIADYLAQISLSLRASSVYSTRGHLRRFDGFLAAEHADVTGAADIGRAHVESYKAWLAARPGRRGGRPTPNTIRANLGTLRMFLERIIEWGWEDAPARVPIFAGDLPRKDEPLPKFLDDPTFALFMRAARAEGRPLTRLAVELLARTGMRIGELCDLEADAVTVIGDAHWLRIPLGKLHNDRYVPLHPHLVELLETYRRTHGTHAHGRLLSGQQGPLNRYAVQRWITTIATTAGIGHVHPHQLRHTLATQAINRGMSLEAIAALLGHYAGDLVKRESALALRTPLDRCEKAGRRRPSVDRPGPSPRRRHVGAAVSA